MAQKLPEIKDDLLRYLAFIQDSLDRNLAEQIGNHVVRTMLDLISKGISPIEGNGRFPAYKWANFANQLKKQKSSIAAEIRKNKAGIHKLGRMNARQFSAHQKLLSRKSANAGALEAVLASKYPFSEKKKYPGKRPRPVNLFLSGEFLSHLIVQITGAAGSVGIEIGFFDELSVKKESGHREGVNTQPQRPIIPIDTEEFVQTIQESIWEFIGEAIDKAAGTGPS